MAERPLWCEPAAHSVALSVAPPGLAPSALIFALPCSRVLSVLFTTVLSLKIPECCETLEPRPLASGDRSNAQLQVGTLGRYRSISCNVTALFQPALERRCVQFFAQLLTEGRDTQSSYRNDPGVCGPNCFEVTKISRP